MGGGDCDPRGNVLSFFDGPGVGGGVGRALGVGLVSFTFSDVSSGSLIAGGGVDGVETSRSGATITLDCSTACCSESGSVSLWTSLQSTGIWASASCFCSSTGVSGAGAITSSGETSASWGLGRSVSDGAGTATGATAVDTGTGGLALRARGLGGRT